MKVLRFLAGWIIGLTLVLLRWTCRVRWHDDVRPALRAAGKPYIYAILHCHQIGAVIGREPGTGAMVSRSIDGDLLVPGLKLNGVVPYRGSSRKKGEDKGGSTALRGLVEHLKSGRPAYLAVDGPRGPRNQVQFGIARLSMLSGATVLTALSRPARRWILKGTWDRFQIPKPFTRVDAFFGEPLTAKEGEPVDDFRQRIEDALFALELEHDPAEAALGKTAADRTRLKLKARAKKGAEAEAEVVPDPSAAKPSTASPAVSQRPRERPEPGQNASTSSSR